MNRLLVFIGMLMMIASCQNAPSLNTDSNHEIQPPSMKTQAKNGMEGAEPWTSSKIDDKGNLETPRKRIEKIIKEGEMRIEVTDLSIAKSRVDSLLSICDGYYEKEQFVHNGGSKNYSLKLRIPSALFDDLLAKLEDGVGSIFEKNIRARDVTEEYLDLEIRLENNKAYQARYLEMLSKATSIEEMLEVQDKIRQIELLIDSGIGRMNYLNDKAEYSTLDLRLFTKPKRTIAASPSFFSKINDGFMNGFEGVLGFILILVNLWPMILLVILILLFRKKIARPLGFGRRFIRQ